MKVLKWRFIQTILRANYKSILKWRENYEGRSSLIYLQIDSWSYQWSSHQMCKERNNISCKTADLFPFYPESKLSSRLPHQAFRQTNHFLSFPSYLDYDVYTFTIRIIIYSFSSSWWKMIWYSGLIEWWHLRQVWWSSPRSC